MRTCKGTFKYTSLADIFKKSLTAVAFQWTSGNGDIALQVSGARS